MLWTSYHLLWSLSRPAWKSRPWASHASDIDMSRWKCWKCGTLLFIHVNFMHFQVPSPMFSAHRDGWSCLATWLSPFLFISSFFLSVLQRMETNTFYAFDLSLFSSKWTWPCESLWLFTFQVRWCNSIYPDWKRHCCFQRLDRSRRPSESLEKTLHAFKVSDQYMTQKQKISAQFHSHEGHNNGHLFH